jgi:hypothetical protein
MKLPDDNNKGDISTHNFCLAPDFAMEPWEK